MSIFSSITDDLPLGQGAKMVIGLGIALLSMGGYKLAMPGSWLPVVGYQYTASSPQLAEAKLDGPVWQRMLHNHAFYRRASTGDSGGLREFHVEAGQRIVFDYRTEMDCGELVLSADLAGIHRRSSNQRDGKHRVVIQESGQGNAEIIASDTGVHRVYLRHRARGDQCGAMWYASWKVRDAAT